MRDDDQERKDFYQELALVAVPVLIGIIPDVLRLFTKDDDTHDPKHANAKKDVKADSFQAYIRRRKQK